MKKSELKRVVLEILKEENIINETKKYQKGDIVVPKIGPHKGLKHTVIYVFPDGKLNIRPNGLRASQIKYRLGAAAAYPEDLE